jgi:hypothetical protein
MKLNQRTANIFEGVGLIIILLSFFFQMVETGIENDIREQENYQIHKKLDYLWAISTHEYSKKHPEAKVNFAIDFKSYLDDYTIYDQDRKNLTNWQKLVNYEWFINVRILLYIAGCFLIVIPKFSRIKD